MILPTFNEAATLESVVNGIAAHGAGILVVDDGSPDGTGDLADELAASLPAVSVLHRPRKEGLGPALAAGFAAALGSGASIVGQMDADGSHDPAELPDLVAAVDAGAGMAIGSRYIPDGSSTGLARTRALLSRLGNAYARVALGISVRDATSGFRIYRREVLAILEPSSAIAQGYACQIEMTWRAQRSGVRIAEVPITFHARREGSSKMSPLIPLEAAALVTRWGLSRLTGTVDRRSHTSHRRP